MRTRDVGGDADFLARHDFFPAEVTTISDNLDVFGLHGGARTLCHGRQLAAIVTDVGDLMVDDQVVLRIDCRLYVVADGAGNDDFKAGD